MGKYTIKLLKKCYLGDWYQNYDFHETVEILGKFRNEECVGYHVIVHSSEGDFHNDYKNYMDALSVYAEKKGKMLKKDSHGLGVKEVVRVREDEFWEGIWDCVEKFVDYGYSMELACDIVGAMNIWENDRENRLPSDGGQQECVLDLARKDGLFQAASRLEVYFGNEEHPVQKVCEVLHIPEDEYQQYKEVLHMENQYAGERRGKYKSI